MLTGRFLIAPFFPSLIILSNLILRSLLWLMLTFCFATHTKHLVLYTSIPNDNLQCKIFRFRTWEYLMSSSNQVIAYQCHNWLNTPRIRGVKTISVPFTKIFYLWILFISMCQMHFPHLPLICCYGFKIGAIATASYDYSSRRPLTHTHIHKNTIRQEQKLCCVMQAIKTTVVHIFGPFFFTVPYFMFIQQFWFMSFVHKS